jgi:type VI secretion system protein ImpK
MNPAIAAYVQPILDRGIELKRQLEGGQTPDLELTQRELMDLLKREVETRHRSDVVGEKDFLGIRYPLACWLDEIFIMDSPWSGEWVTKTLEWAMYGDRQAARRFWAQAEMAMKTRGDDVVEVFFLCVLLGFRGRYRDEPERLKQEFIEPARRTLRRSLAKKWEEPRKLVPPANVPPLHGRERFRRMILVWLATVVPLTIAIVAVYIHLGTR